MYFSMIAIRQTITDKYKTEFVAKSFNNPNKLSFNHSFFISQLHSLVLILDIFNMRTKAFLIIALAGFQMTAALPVFNSPGTSIDTVNGALKGAPMPPSGYEIPAKSVGRSNVAVSL
jgi:hypothetical protein